MTPERWQGIKELFLAARELAAPEQARFLDERCADDSALRAEVEALLANEAQAKTFLEMPAMELAVPAGPTRGALATGEPAFATPQADSFPGYQIIRELHRGGQGIVYQAIQKATKRKVAIKVLREGPFASHGEKARFEREVEILGQLSHPSIVGVHDSGEAGGHFYYVMDYISGQPLDVWTASSERTIEETLRLFQKVCEAINTAHLRGVIHRDLKPGNIRVDAEGQPHVLDFGLAKLVHGATEASLMTMTGQFMGSLPWASPEQAEALPGKIDIRTDVYSLGVILYQMLTGKFPYEVVGNMRDVLDRIMRAEPTRPSTIRRQINDEVETIALKCLSKERERRYQSAGELARDIAHYLNGEPIEAKRDSAFYVLKKHLRRYRLAVGFAASLTLLVAIALGASLVLWREAVHERDRAVAAEAQQARERAQAETARAAEAEQRAEAVQMKDEAAYKSYVACVGAADAAVAASDAASALRYLEQAPEAFRDWEWSYLKSSADRSLATFQAPAKALCASFTASDAQLVLACRDGAVYRLDATTGKALGILHVGRYRPHAIAFTSDGMRVAAGGRDGVVKVWATAGGDEPCSLGTTGPPVTALAFTPDGAQLAVGADDGTVTVWDVFKSHVLRHLRISDKRITGLAVGMQCTVVACTSDDQTLTISNILSGAGHQVYWGVYYTYALAVSPDNRHLAFAQNDHTVKLLDVDRGLELPALRGHRQAIASLAFSPDGMYLVSGSVDGSIIVWDVRQCAQVNSLFGHQGPVNSLAFRSDGSCLLSASDDRSVRLWAAGQIHSPLVLREHASYVTQAVCSHAGTRIASASYDGSIKLWDPARCVATATFRGSGSALYAVAFSADDTLMAAGDSTGTISLWDRARGTELRTLRGHEQQINRVVFSADGRHLVSNSDDGTIRIWDVVTGAELAKLRRSSRGMAITSDGRLVASGDGQDIRLWSVTEGTELQVLGQSGSVLALAFSRDGQLLASSGHGEVRIWDVATGKVLRTLPRHAWTAAAIAFNPSGTRLASGGSDQSIKIWDVSRGCELLTLRGHAAEVMSVAFSPDGMRLVSAGYDGTIRVWDSADSEAWLHAHQHAIDTHRTACSLVSAAVQKWGSPHAAMEQLMKDRSIGEDLRDDASEVLQQRREEQALSLIDGLFDDGRTLSDVREYLRSREKVGDWQEADAMRTLDSAESNARSIVQQAWTIVAAADGEPESYSKALRWARLASYVLPDEACALSVRGIAEYRSGDYARALETLTKVDAARTAVASVPSSSAPETATRDGEAAVGAVDFGYPGDVAFIAMSLGRLGRHNEALVALKRLRSLMEQARWAKDEEATCFAREAELLIPDPPGGRVAGATLAPSTSEPAESP